MKYGLKGLVVEYDLIAIITIISNDYTANPLKERLNPPNSSIRHKFKFVKLLKDSGVAPYDLENEHDNSVPSISFILGKSKNQTDSKLESVEEQIQQSLFNNIKQVYNVDIVDDNFNAKSNKLQWKNNSPYQRVNLRFGCLQPIDGSTIKNCTHPTEWPSEIYFGHAFIASKLISKEQYENLPLSEPWMLVGTWRHGSFFIEEFKQTVWTYHCGPSCPGK